MHMMLQNKMKFVSPVISLINSLLGFSPKKVMLG